jgi:diguanylate cyclase (GGDEF)-like protein/PAS domain S-box-containing protein
VNEPDQTFLPELESDFFKELLGRLEDPVFVKNNQHQWVFANQAFKDLIGCEDLIGKTDADLLPADQVENFYEGDNNVIRTQTSLTQEEQVGEGCYALVKKSPIRLPDQSIGLFGIIFDISEYRKVQLEVEKLRLAKVQSRTDPLTGLANRRYLETYFAQINEESQSVPMSTGLLHIDLDYFKAINDTKGHLVGDAVLVHLASTMRDSVGSTGFIARIGGDEFVVVIRDISQSALKGLAQKIISAVEKPVVLENEKCAFSISVGVALDSNGSLTLNEMLKFADMALYYAKDNGRGRYEEFTPRVQHEHNESRRQRDELRRALDENEFIPFYQPVYDAATLQMIGVEALARWDHPERGILLPFEFLHVVASERRMVDLDRAIMSAALNDARILQESGCAMPGLSINLSPESLASDDLVEYVQQLKPFPNGVFFELVESMLLDEPNGVLRDRLDGLRALGISLDIDDFGSGHTSLLGMLEAKPDRVKIDKRLTLPMTESQKHYDLVKSVIQIAQSLNMETIAEGVESQLHCEQLLELGCTSLQGFGLARPMPLSDLKALLLEKDAA